MEEQDYKEGYDYATVRKLMKAASQLVCDIRNSCQFDRYVWRSGEYWVCDESSISDIENLLQEMQAMKD